MMQAIRESERKKPFNFFFWYCVARTLKVSAPIPDQSSLGYRRAAAESNVGTSKLYDKIK